MSVENDPSFWKWLVGVGGSASVAVVGAWKYVDAKLEKKVSKETFDDAVKRADISRQELRESIEQQRKETRENVIGLHGKLDGLRDHVDEKFDRLADLIRSRP